MAKRSSLGSIRKRLSDITNSNRLPKSPVRVMPDKKTSPNVSSAKEYIDQLVKENMALAGQIAEKNKLMELTGMELQKMRINLQKLRLQNWNLAQSNSHILAELNLGKEKLKALHHEIVCKDALLKAKNSELQMKVNVSKNEDGCSQAVSKEGENAVVKHQYDHNDKLCKSRRGRPARSRSMGSSTACQQVSEKETSTSKSRQCLRRQSAKFKSEGHDSMENLFEIEEAKFPVGQPLNSAIMCVGSASLLGTFIKKEEKDEHSASKSEAGESQRTSLGRPLRKAVEKVHSYKEIPLNIKMRRSE
ncbi:hypothetical protein NMG60_11015630 [Bertholletia excelsa]